MPLVTSLDGKVYELDEATLASCRIPDEQVAKLGDLDPLPSGPALAPDSGAAQEWVQVRPGPGNSTYIDLKIPNR